MAVPRAFTPAIPGFLAAFTGSLIFKIAAFTILCSIIAHGLTDTVGAKWVERRLGRG